MWLHPKNILLVRNREAKPSDVSSALLTAIHLLLMTSVMVSRSSGSVRSIPLIRSLAEILIRMIVLGFIQTFDLLDVNYCVNFSVHTIMTNGFTTHYIELFSPCKSWPNSKGGCTHLVQYNPYLANSSCLIYRSCEWTLRLTRNKRISEISAMQQITLIILWLR